MKKRFIYYFICFISYSLSSCSGDNLYEFQDLSQHDDYIIDVMVKFEDPDASFAFTTITYETNGYDKLLNESWSFSGPAASNAYFHRAAVKEYRNAGIEFFPEENIRSVTIQIYNLVDYYPIVKYTSSSPEDVSIFYNFETGEKTIKSL